MGSRRDRAPAPTSVLVDRYDYGTALSKYRTDIADYEAREKELSEDLDLGERIAALGPRPLPPEVDPTSPVHMPDPDKRTGRRARRTKGRGGRVSTIFTSGLGG